MYRYIDILSTFLGLHGSTSFAPELHRSSIDPALIRSRHFPGHLARWNFTGKLVLTRHQPPCVLGPSTRPRDLTRERAGFGKNSVTQCATGRRAVKPRPIVSVAFDKVVSRWCRLTLFTAGDERPGDKRESRDPAASDTSRISDVADEIRLGRYSPEPRRSGDVLAITPAFFFLHLPRSFLFHRSPSTPLAWSSPLASGETAPQPVVNHPRVAHTFRELTRPPLRQTGQSSSRVYSRRIPADEGARGPPFCSRVVRRWRLRFCFCRASLCFFQRPCRGIRLRSRGGGIFGWNEAFACGWLSAAWWGDNCVRLIWGLKSAGDSG